MSPSTRSRVAGSSSGWRRRTSTFVRRLVRGVRSSWPASCASRCCCSRDRRRASSIIAKLCARRPVSSDPPEGTSTSRRPLSAIASVAAVRRVTGRVTRDAIHQPTSAASIVIEAPMTAKRTRRLARTCRTSSSSRLSWTAPPPAPRPSGSDRRPPCGSTTPSRGGEHHVVRVDGQWFRRTTRRTGPLTRRGTAPRCQGDRRPGRRCRRRERWPSAGRRPGGVATVGRRSATLELFSDRSISW